MLRGVDASIIFGAFLPTIVLLRATAEHSTFVAQMRGENVRWTAARRNDWALTAALALGAILNAGSLAILRPMLPAALPPEERAQLAESAVRGLGLAVCWSPFFAASAFAGRLVPGVEVWQTVVIGLGLACLGWVLSHLLYSRGAGMRGIFSGVRPLLLPIALCVMLVATMAAVTGLGGLEAIVVLIPPLCVAYLARHGRAATLRVFARVLSGLGGLADEIIIMTAALMLGTAVRGLTLDPGLMQQSAWLASLPGVLIAGEVALVVAAGACGLHPMIGAALILPLASGLHGGIADAVLAHVVVLGWALSSTVAIWSMPVPVAGKLFDVPLRRLALGRNAGFVVAFGACACAALAGLNWTLMHWGRAS